MTDEQKHRALARVLDSMRKATKTLISQAEIVDAHADLLKNINNATIDESKLNDRLKRITSRV